MMGPVLAIKRGVAKVTCGRLPRGSSPHLQRDRASCRIALNLLRGNSNWRGPIWFPVNFLLIQALAAFAEYYGPAFTIEYPTGSGSQRTLDEVADDVADRLTRILLRDQNGRRPSLRGQRPVPKRSAPARLRAVPRVLHADTGAGLRASHQTV